MKIKELELFTSRIEEQCYFYSKILGLNIIGRSHEFVSFEIGNSILKFTKRENCTPYHFAFNIPSNKAEEALDWLESRVEVLNYGEHKIQYFDFWDADAIYFYDNDYNIVELISRKTLDVNATEIFDVNQFLEISEIGLPSNDIEIEYNLLKSAAGLEIYSGDLNRFCSLGDEHGLFIIINKHIKKEWFPTNDRPIASDFKIWVEERGSNVLLEFKNEVLKVV